MQYYSMVIFVFVLKYFSIAYAHKAPSFFKSCEDNSSECLKSAIQSALPRFIQGMPELGIDRLDPFIIDKLELMLPGGLRMEFTQGFSKGLRKCTVDEARMEEDRLEVQFRCNLTIKGKYKSSGRFLMFAINGDGDSMIKCKNIKIQCHLKLGSSVERDGQVHLEIQNFKSNHSYDGQVFYRMTNLIKGNPQISNMVVDFMNRNWRMVAEEFGKPIVDYGIESVLINIKKLFKTVPMAQLINAPVNSLLNF